LFINSLSSKMALFLITLLFSVAYVKHARLEMASLGFVPLMFFCFE
jgi:hypothetical protein